MKRKLSPKRKWLGILAVVVITSSVFYIANRMSGGDFIAKNISEIKQEAGAGNATNTPDILEVMSGGDTSGNRYNNVLSTTDGKTWTEINKKAPWSKRDGVGLTFLNGKILLMGGWDPAGPTGNALNDVWSSLDGKKWILVTPTTTWSPRSDFGLVLDSKGMLTFVAGWNHGSTLFKDIWTSRDGLTWGKTFSKAGPGDLFNAASLNGNVYSLSAGGEVYSSINGWKNSLSYIPNSSPITIGWTTYNRRINGPAMVSFKGKIWVLGGFLYDFDAKTKSTVYRMSDEVYSSPDGKIWTLETHAPWKPRTNHIGVVFQNKLWVIGGYDAVTYPQVEFRDVWSSINGKVWVKESSISLPFGPIASAAVVVPGHL